MIDIEPGNAALTLDHKPDYSPGDVVWSAYSITASDSNRALLFESRGMLFGLSADSVSEVTDVPVTQRVPGSAAWYQGVSVYRNRPVPVIDVAAYIAPESPPLEFHRAIVVRAASSTYLIAADKILNLCSLSPDDQLSATNRLPDYAGHRAIRKVCAYENRLLAVLDLPELLRCTKLLRECASS